MLKMVIIDLNPSLNDKFSLLCHNIKLCLIKGQNSNLQTSDLSFKK